MEQPSNKNETKYQTSLTGIKEIDREILLNLEGIDLIRACQSNKHLHDICDEDFWKTKLDGISTILRHDKPEDITWQQWYLFWLNHRYGIKLIYTLGLEPIQVYVSLSSKENRLTEGAEAFETIDLTLQKALETGDDDLIEYFWNAYLIVSNKYRRDLLHDDYYGIDLVDYTSLADLAYDQGFEDIALELIETYSQVIESFDVDALVEQYQEIARILGKRKKKKLLKNILAHSSVDDDLGKVYASYVMGLIEGYHNKEAIVEFNNLSEDDQLESLSQIIISAVSSKNQEMIDFLRKETVDDEEIDRISAIYQDEDNLLLSKKLPEPKTLEELQRLIKEQKPFTLNIKTTPLELLLFKFNFEKHAYAIETVKKALLAGRYDFILSLNWNDEKLFDENFWRDILNNVITATQYKDLALYLLITCANTYPDVYTQALVDVDSGKYELVNLLKRLMNININELDEADFHSLLIAPYQDD